MISRFFYHFFWNFYDYLGSYFLLGGATGVALLGLLSGVGVVARQVASPAIQLALLVVGVVVFVTALAVICGGFFEFAARAARDEPARMPHFLDGMKNLFRRYMIYLFLAILLIGLIVANIVFYLQMANAVTAPAVRMMFFSLAMAFVWGGFCAILFLHAVFPLPARFSDETRLLKQIRQGFMFFILAPWFWAVVVIFHLLMLGILAVSIVGFLFMLPIFASLSTTAVELISQHWEFLKQAKQELGAEHAIRVYQRRAKELAEEWEARRPRRTFRELIKPWEN